MALAIALIAYAAVCGPAPGGLARMWAFDGQDFDFTQAAPGASGAANPYSAVAKSTGAASLPGAKMYPITFGKKSAKYTNKQSNKGCADKYEHQWEFKFPNLSQAVHNWSAAVSKASCCGGIGIAFQLNSGKIFIAGERVVNGQPVDIPMDIIQDGSSSDSGTLIDDDNAKSVVLKGDYTRELYEFTGGVASLVALQ